MDNSLNTQALPPGTRLEEFLIERVLGAGGFGITYLATDTALGRQVVIKENLPVQFCFRDTHSLTVAPRHTTGEDAENFAWSLENFSKEAAMLASLDHPGIVRVHRSFRAFGTAYFVMPFVEGEPLDALIRKRTDQGKLFDADEITGLLEHVLDALAYLHDRGIYHRDIKPGNLLITDAGTPVLIDFGSARQKLSERSMTVVESPGYTPFEQLQSRGNVGPWSDLYALGATVARAITGETLPKANDRAFDDPWVPLADRLDIAARLPATLLSSIDKAVQSRAQDRWQDGREWMAALDGNVVPVPLQGDDRRAKELPKAEGVSNAPKTKRGRYALVAVAVVILIAGGGVWAASQISNKREAQAKHHALAIAGNLAHVRGGIFTMGNSSADSDAWIISNAPVVDVHLQEFHMASHQVTWAFWNDVRNWAVSNGYSDISTGGGKAINHPVHSVSWWDVVKWCNARSEREGLMPVYRNASGTVFKTGMIVPTPDWKANGYRLPTEAEWEKAARGGVAGQRFPWGDTISHREANFRNNGDESYVTGSTGYMPEFSNAGGAYTSPVGSFMPNGFGLYDLSGNVWEWCWDWYSLSSYSSGAMDPKGPASGSFRVIRGGSWNNQAFHSRSANRNMIDPSGIYMNVGFRPVRSSIQ